MTKTVERDLGYASFVVRDIHCPHCAGTLERTVAGLPGVVCRILEPCSPAVAVGWASILQAPRAVLDAGESVRRGRSGGARTVLERARSPHPIDS